MVFTASSNQVKEPIKFQDGENEVSVNYKFPTGHKENEYQSSLKPFASWAIQL